MNELEIPEHVKNEMQHLLTKFMLVGAEGKRVQLSKYDHDKNTVYMLELSAQERTNPTGKSYLCHRINMLVRCCNALEYKESDNFPKQEQEENEKFMAYLRGMIETLKQRIEVIEGWENDILEVKTILNLTR